MDTSESCVESPEEILELNSGGESSEEIPDLNRNAQPHEEIPDLNINVQPHEEIPDLNINVQPHEEIPDLNINVQPHEEIPELNSSVQSNEANDISVEQFKRNELLSYFNSLVDYDLLVISTRNIHLKSIHEEFLKFSMFINKPLYRDQLLVFLTPVFQHLYLLLLSHKGKADADKLTTFYRYLPFPPNVLDDLLQCNTCEAVEKLINSGLTEARIKVKLSSYAYHTLMNWLRDSFSQHSEMFHILRVLHENFHLDIYHDKDDEEFAPIECQVLQGIKEWHEARKGEKKSDPEITFETIDTSENEDDVMAQKMAELDIATETSEIPESSETSEIPESSEIPETSEMSEAPEMSEISEKSKTPETSEKSKTPEMPETHKRPERVGTGTNFQWKSSMFKLRDSARRYLEKVKKEAKEKGWTQQQIEEALLNPPDPNEEVPSENDDPEMDFHEDTTSVVDGSAAVVNQPEPNIPVAIEKDVLEMMDPLHSSIEDVSTVTEIFGKEIYPDQMEVGAAANLTEIFSKIVLNASDVTDVVVPGSSSLDHAVPVSPGGNEEDDIEMQENVKDTDQDPTDENEEDDTDVQEIVTDQDPNDDIEIDPKDEENKDKFEPLYIPFKKSYKSSFHSAYPVTISGKDVLCSSDVSTDLNYLACGFESRKICTWRLGEHFDLQPIGTLRGHKGIVYALSIDSNTKTLISGSHDRTVRIWDIEESKCRSVVLAHSAPVYAVCASPNSKYFLSASEDKLVMLFWYDQIYPLRVYAGHSQEAINCVRFHPNCAYFASASSDGNLFLFKINEDSCPVRMFTKHIAKVYTLSFSPCGKQLASADVDGILIIWDILTYTPIKTFETGQGIRSISYDTSGSLIAALFYYKSWKIYNIAEDDLDVAVEVESVGVPKSVHFSDDNKMLIIEYVEADKRAIAERKGKPLTAFTVVN